MDKLWIIFPEGTRSSGPVLNRFKHGSLKLPIRAGATIIPITIAGSYKMMEQKRRIQPADVLVTIHDPVDTSVLTNSDTRQLCAELTKVIERAV